MADIFREVDEDLRRDNLTQLWKKYGVFVVGAAVLLIVATALYVGWREWRLAERLEFSERLAAAGDMVDAGNAEEAMAAYANLSEDAGGGYEVLAGFHEAALAAEAGNRERAAAIYDALAEESDAAPVYRNLAVLLGVMHRMENGDPAALIERLGPLTADDSDWRYSARELTALLERRRGNRERAIELFSGLEQAADAPPDLRARAREMLAAMDAAGEQAVGKQAGDDQ